MFLIDTLRMHDIVPNWRPLTGAVYLARVACCSGCEPMGWRLVNLTVHLSSLVAALRARRARDKRPAVGAVASADLRHLRRALRYGHLHHRAAARAGDCSSCWRRCSRSSPTPTTVSATGGPSRSRSRRSCSRSSRTKARSSSRRCVVLAYVVYSRRWQKAPSAARALHAVPFAALADGWLSFYESCTCAAVEVRRLRLGAARLLELRRLPLVHRLSRARDPGDARCAALGDRGRRRGFGVCVRGLGPKLARVAVPGIAAGVAAVRPGRDLDRVALHLRRRGVLRAARGASCGVRACTTRLQPRCTRGCACRSTCWRCSSSRQSAAPVWLADARPRPALGHGRMSDGSCS